MGFNKKDEGSPERVTVPVLKDAENTTISNEDKAEIIAKAFIGIHSFNNLTEEGRRAREETREAHLGV